MVAIQRLGGKTKVRKVKMETISLTEVFKVEKWGNPETAVYFWPPVNKELEMQSVRRCYTYGKEAIVIQWERKTRRWLAYHMKNPNREFKFS